MNQQIEQARKAALELLQPSKKELEHGLALHAESLVIEPYGFTPRAAIDRERIEQAVEAGAGVGEVQELIEQCIIRAGTDPAERAEFEEAWDAAGVTCVFQNAGEESQATMTLLRRLANYTYLSDLVRDYAFRAACPDDVVRAHEEGKRCFVMTGNGVPLRERWESVESELQYLRLFFQLGVREMHLTYNRANMIGDGCAESRDGGLTDFGRAVVKEMGRVGVMVDVAHSGQRTGQDAAQVSDRPIVASHTGAMALGDHFRCKTDETVRAICDGGGVVGVCAVPAFLGRSGDINAMLDHVDYLVKLVGPQHVAIATDLAYLSERAHEELRLLGYPMKRREPWESYWPHRRHADPKWNDPQKLKTLAWTNWPLFTVGMVQRGHSDEAIRQILGQNVLRVFRAVWDGRDPTATGPAPPPS